MSVRTQPMLKEGTVDGQRADTGPVQLTFSSNQSSEFSQQILSRLHLFFSLCIVLCLLMSVHTCTLHIWHLKGTGVYKGICDGAVGTDVFHGNELLRFSVALCLRTRARSFRGGAAFSRPASASGGGGEVLWCVAVWRRGWRLFLRRMELHS